MSRKGGRIFDVPVEVDDEVADAGATPPPRTAEPALVEVAEPVVLAPARTVPPALPVGVPVGVPMGVADTPPATTQGPAAALQPATQPGGAGALARFQASGQALVAQGAWRLRQVGTAGLIGVGLLVGAAVLYVANTLPQGQAIGALKAQLAKLGPLVHGGPLAPQAQVALGGLPSRDEAPDVLGRIYQEAQAAGVELPRGTYEYLPARDGVAAHYRMTFPVHAGYPQLRTFMDNTLIALPSVAVEGLKIERKNVADESVDAELKLAAFVRDGT